MSLSHDVVQEAARLCESFTTRFSACVRALVLFHFVLQRDYDVTE